MPSVLDTIAPGYLGMALSNRKGLYVHFYLLLFFCRLPFEDALTVPRVAAFGGCMRNGLEELYEKFKIFGGSWSSTQGQVYHKDNYL
jgi:hypothetical protein